MTAPNCEPPLPPRLNPPFTLTLTCVARRCARAAPCNLVGVAARRQRFKRRDVGLQGACRRQEGVHIRMCVSMRRQRMQSACFCSTARCHDVMIQRPLVALSCPQTPTPNPDPPKPAPYPGLLPAERQRGHRLLQPEAVHHEFARRPVFSHAAQRLVRKCIWRMQRGKQRRCHAYGTTVCVYIISSVVTNRI